MSGQRTSSSRSRRCWHSPEFSNQWKCKRVDQVGERRSSFVSSRLIEFLSLMQSAFTSSATDLLTEMKDRLGTRSSKSSFETQVKRRKRSSSRRLTSILCLAGEYGLQRWTEVLVLLCFRLTFFYWSFVWDHSIRTRTSCLHVSLDFIWKKENSLNIQTSSFRSRWSLFDSPEFDCTIVGARGQQTGIFRIPRQSIDILRMRLSVRGDQGETRRSIARVRFFFTKDTDTVVARCCGNQTG